MRRFLSGLVAVLSLSLITAQLSEAAVTPGTKCLKAGATSTYHGKKYTCVKSGKNLVWDKGVAIPKPIPAVTPTPTPTVSATPTPTPTVSATPTPTPSAFVFTDVCQKDPEVPAEWVTYQEFALKVFGCARPYRFLDVKLTESKPTLTLTASTSFQQIAECKLPTQNNSNNLGFIKNGWQFNGDLQIQVIPVEFTDFKSSGSPIKEYGKYLDYIKEMYFKLSDGNTRITFKTPDSFIQVGKELKSYVTPGVIEKNGVFSWKKLDLPSYQGDIFSAADKVINFKGTEMGIVLVPLSVPSEYIAHGGGFRMSNVSTAEGVVKFNYLMPPASEVDNMSWFGVEPFLHLHEFFHATGQLDDHYGDDGKGPNLGTGRWGAMSGMLTDFILWDKWLAGMLRDSQVICGSSNQSGTYWIKPASYSGIYEKLLVIPISSTRAIAIESERAAGLNFKLSPISEGALVYTIDTSDIQHGSGISVIRPLNRTGPIQVGSFILADAPLKPGESLTVWGYKITVVESGTFGDVIKVEKA
jgi:hypothetical protein